MFEKEIYLGHVFSIFTLQIGNKCDFHIKKFNTKNQIYTLTGF